MGRLQRALKSTAPRPRPSIDPGRQKLGYWFLAIVGGAICVAVLAAALAPSPGHKYQPIGGVLGTLGLAFSIWIAWYASAIPPAAPLVNTIARRRKRARAQSRRLLQKDPALAAELGIGRPDLQRDFDDGGLVDVNHVPAEVLSDLLGLDASLAARVVDLRAGIGGFTSLADMESLLEIAPSTVAAVADRLIFCR